MSAIKAVLGRYNGGGSYNFGGCNSSSGYNIGGYIMVACSALHKQLYWEFGVSHNCICIISEGVRFTMAVCCTVQHATPHSTA